MFKAKKTLLKMRDVSTTHIDANCKEKRKGKNFII